MKELDLAQALADRAKALNVLHEIADSTICYNTKGMAQNIINEILNS